MTPFLFWMLSFCVKAGGTGDNVIGETTSQMGRRHRSLADLPSAARLRVGKYKPNGPGFGDSKPYAASVDDAQAKARPLPAPDRVASPLRAWMICAAAASPDSQAPSMKPCVSSAQCSPAKYS